MTARDELFLYLPDSLWLSKRDALIDAHAAEVLREWAAKIRETGTAKGWSTWAAAYIDPDVEFVDTAMPSTETIVAELRRLDRAANFRQAADAIEREQAREERAERDRFGRVDHETELQGAAVRAKASLLRRLADEAERGKDTSGGRQPSAGESTPDFFQPGHTYAATGGWRFRCDAVTTHPEDGELTALGWRFFNGRWDPIAYHQDDWDVHQAVGHADVTEAGPADAPSRANGGSEGERR